MSDNSELGIVSYDEEDEEEEEIDNKVTKNISKTDGDGFASYEDFA